MYTESLAEWKQAFTDVKGLDTDLGYLHVAWVLADRLMPKLQNEIVTAIVTHEKVLRGPLCAWIYENTSVESQLRKCLVLRNTIRPFPQLQEERAEYEQLPVEFLFDLVLGFSKYRNRNYYADKPIDFFVKENSLFGS